MNASRPWKALRRFFKWQIISRLGGYPVIVPLVDKVSIAIQAGMSGATGNFYNGLHEYREMAFTLHLLRSGDIFCDIGANAGIYTLLAAGKSNAITYSFEPSPIAFSWLERSVLLNKLSDHVKLFQVALGASEKLLELTTSYDAGNYILTNNTKKSLPTTTVQVNTLDACLVRNCPSLIKIDVEGFENEVLNGATNTLAQSNLKAIIIELNGSGNRYGFNEENIHDKLLDLGFKPFEYNPFIRQLKGLKSWGTHNTIYIRDLDWVTQRLNTAPKFVINQQQI